MIRILSLGNSFSTDATRYLQQIAGGEIYSRNLFIGGCSLERHWNNIQTSAVEYEYQEDAEKIKMISANDPIENEEWDYITVQQVSNLTGDINSYEPYFGEIIKYIKKHNPDTKIVFHRTWAYDIGSDHGGFVAYDNDQKKMYDCIINATDTIAKKYDLPIIKVGDAVQKMRQVKEFNYPNGGKTLTRDGFHLSFDYGRYLAGLVWYEFFTGKSANDVTFAPNDTDKQLIEVIKKNI